MLLRTFFSALAVAFSRMRGGDLLHEFLQQKSSMHNSQGFCETESRTINFSTLDFFFNTMTASEFSTCCVELR